MLGLPHKAWALWQAWAPGQGLAEAYRSGRERVYREAVDYILDTRTPDFIILETVLLGNRLYGMLRADGRFQEQYALWASVPSEEQPSLLVYARTHPGPAALVP